MEQPELKNYWDLVYNTKSGNQVSWFQPYPTTSIHFIQLFNLPLTANIIDIGGGDSLLVDALLDKGYQNIYVLDISANAIEQAKKRLGKKAEQVNWIVSDITTYQPTVFFDLWHDRAAFHFLTTNDNIDKYVSIAENAIKPHGLLLLGTFSENGPTKCSGLDIKQYTQNSMCTQFEKQFERVQCIQEDHKTPFNTSQNFLYCSFRKKECNAF